MIDHELISSVSAVAGLVWMSQVSQSFGNSPYNQLLSQENPDMFFKIAHAGFLGIERV
jgi:hypothetical protein